MKKLFLLLALTSTFSACSNDGGSNGAGDGKLTPSANSPSGIYYSKQTGDQNGQHSPETLTIITDRNITDYAVHYGAIITHSFDIQVSAGVISMPAVSTQTKNYRCNGHEVTMEGGQSPASEFKFKKDADGLEITFNGETGKLANASKEDADRILALPACSVIN